MELRKKSNTNENKSIFSTRQERVQMQVDLNNIGHITSLLTDLYVNPIEATVRETVSNAIDTTRRLPREQRKPVRIVLPTEINPQFVVTDFGEGMDRDTLANVFAQYGASTKGTDLQQIGAFGLGAKAPLSYASKFTVESTKDGITTEVFLSSTSEGNFCDILDSKETGLPNGTTVTIPVNVDNYGDFRKFEKAVLENYAVFSYGVELEIKGAEAPNYYQEEIGEIKVGEVNGEPVYSKIYSVTETEEEFVTDLLDIPINEPDIDERIVNHGIGYTLSGWNYSLGRGKMFYLELVPGMVDFSSSRDEITINDRFEEVKKLIKSQIVDLLTKKRLSTLKDRKWNSLEAVDNLKGFSVEEIEEMNPEINGTPFIDMLTETDQSLIPVEFSIRFPKDRKMSFSMFKDRLDSEIYSKISKAKESFFFDVNSFRQPIERVLFSKHTDLVVITDLPKENTEKKHIAVLRKTFNKLRTINYELFNSYEGGKTYVVTHLSLEEVNKLRPFCRKLTHARVFPYSELIEIEQEKKVETKSTSFRCYVSEQEKNSSVLLPKNAYDSFRQTQTDLFEITRRKNKKLLVINNSNNTWSYNSLQSKIFWYIKKEGLDGLDVIFMRKSELNKSILKNLLPVIDYYFIVNGCNFSFPKELLPLVEDKNFDDLESTKEEKIPSELALFQKVRGNYQVGTFRRLLDENEIDDSLFLTEYEKFAIFGETKSKEEKLLMNYGSSEDIEFSEEEQKVYKKFLAIKKLWECLDRSFRFNWGQELIVEDESDRPILNKFLIEYMKLKWEELIG